jgi:hypothetical protein
MKEDLTTFTCDNCKKKETVKQKTGYPYDKGWVYLFNLKGKIASQHYDIQDKHFCCLNCEIEFIRKMIEALIQPKKDASCTATGHQIEVDDCKDCPSQDYCFPSDKPK